MKKLGIITLHGYNNYGNNLQNYALLYTLEKLGYDVSTLIIEEKNINKIKNKIKYISKLNSMTTFKRLTEKIFKENNDNNAEEKVILKSRENQFRQFSKQYLNESFYQLDNHKDLEKLQEFSFFVSG